MKENNNGAGCIVNLQISTVPGVSWFGSGFPAFPFRVCLLVFFSCVLSGLFVALFYCRLFPVNLRRFLLGVCNYIGKTKSPLKRKIKGLQRGQREAGIKDKPGKEKKTKEKSPFRGFSFLVCKSDFAGVYVVVFTQPENVGGFIADFLNHRRQLTPEACRPYSFGGLCLL